MIDAAVAAIGERTALEPRVGVVLGSGLGGFADRVEDGVVIPYGEIPGWPVSTALGHAGTLVLGSFAGVPVAVMKGRAHIYEGHPADRVVFGVRVLGRLGAEVLVVTNACGGVREDLSPGTSCSCRITSTCRAPHRSWGRTTMRWGRVFRI